MSGEQQTGVGTATIAANGRVDRNVRGWLWLLWKVFGRHKWNYYNPYDRTCEVCGRREVSHCADIYSWNRAWWETWNEGNEWKHYEAPNAGDHAAPVGGRVD